MQGVRDEGSDALEIAIEVQEASVDYFMAHETLYILLK